MIEVIVAGIGTIGTIIVAIIGVLLKRENRQQHEDNKHAFTHALGRVEGKVDTAVELISDHINTPHPQHHSNRKAS